MDRLRAKFKHDCVRCVYLGGYTNVGERNKDCYYDLYVCSEGNMKIPTVIARFSDNGPDYNSGMAFGVHGSVEPLLEAFRRAYQEGYLQVVATKKLREGGI